MANVHRLPFLRRQAKLARPSPFTPWGDESKPVEIVAPDQYCAALLLGYAAPIFPAELVTGPGWIVRLQPPPGADWVPDLLVLVERWLTAVPLPATKVTYGGRSYLIDQSFDSSQLAAPLSRPAA